MLPPPIDLRGAVRELVVLGSSSRGGSSIFADVLRRSPKLVHFRAEINPVLRLFGVDGGADDALGADDPIPPGLGEALAWECGNPTDDLGGDEGIFRFTVELAARLAMQWPELTIEHDFVDTSARDVLAGLARDEGWPEGRFLDPQAFHVRLLARLRRHFPEIHPAAYDLDRRLIAAFCPGPYPDPYVPGALIEEPPFVLVTPWRLATAEDLATRPLVVKTPSNAYRLPWLERLFPRARLRLLHLTRNVGASVNGLMDGWRHPGFHSHHIPGRVHIPGYSDVVAGGADWWKFDRPPGWAELLDQPLERVCAFQWRSAHEALLRDGPADRFRLRFEDVLGSPDRQAGVLLRLSHWLGVEVEQELARVLGSALPLVMATETPRHRRWFDRFDLLAPLLAEPTLSELMERIGYDPDPAAWD